jgi:hypothetical protein
MELGASGERVRRLTKRVVGGGGGREEAGYFPKLDLKPQRGKKKYILWKLISFTDNWIKNKRFYSSQRKINEIESSFSRADEAIGCVLPQAARKYSVKFNLEFM